MIKRTAERRQVAWAAGVPGPYLYEGADLVGLCRMWCRNDLLWADPTVAARNQREREESQPFAKQKWSGTLATLILV